MVCLPGGELGGFWVLVLWLFAGVVSLVLLCLWFDCACAICVRW